MATVTDICNAALSHCGTRSKISSLEEASPEANACFTHFALLRDYMLRAFDWNFARLTAALAELPDPPARWARKYALPADCVRIRRPNDVPVLTVPETWCELAADKDSAGAPIGVLLTDAARVSAIYTGRVIDTLRWDDGFATAMTYGLGARICYELTGKDDRVRTLTQLWQASLQQAAAEAASEGSTFGRICLPEALLARGYSGASG